MSSFDFNRASYDSSPGPGQPEYGPAPVQPDAGDFARALSFGLAGVVAGAVVYALFIVITHIQIGYLAIGIAWLVARAMMAGSGGRGGRKYQLAAVILTALSVALGNALMFLWQVHREIGVAFSPANLFKLLPLGFEDPFLEFRTNVAGGALGLFILFIGFRAAWRMTSGEPGATQHPFTR